MIAKLIQISCECVVIVCLLVFRYLIGDAYGKLNQPEKSNDYLAKALELSEKSPVVPYNIISEYIEEERYKFINI
jgi:hypothetical protein